MDELELVGRLKDVAPLRPQAYERARATLGAAMAESPAATVAAPVRRAKFAWARGFRLGVPGKIGLGAVGAAAVAALVVSVAAPAPQSPAQAPAASAPESRLVTLAASVKASSTSVQGDASLVIRTTTAPDGSPYVTYNLYTDSGDAYFAETAQQLSSAIAHHDNLAEPIDAAKVAAARFAATGDLTEARTRMVNAVPNAWGLGLSPADAQRAWDEAMAKDEPIFKAKGIKTPLPRPTGQDLQNRIDNNLWTNATDALFRGAENPDVRAGVLRLLSTIPAVAVANSTTGGRPTLTLTAGPSLFGGTDAQVLTIDAHTGLPLISAWKDVSATYKSSRVTLAQVRAGKF
ncbi:hypothetical protein AB0383_45035 [Amycolatopsis sp. NPDC051373]|uniref:hypothetical protein n=1 Tax=Amycolatopsis sp. NPDC051373 TaxID=3155801 RepID=UPI00344B7947